MGQLLSSVLTRAEESELVSRAKKNDTHAYEALYRAHVGRVFALCLRLVADRDMAEDLTQEGFVLAWKSLPKFRGDSAFGSWLYRIATNACLSYLRRQTPLKNSLDIEDNGVESEWLRSDPTPERGMDLEEAIATLPDGARTVFVLYSLEGYTHEEIGGMLGIATGSSKAQLHRARKLLMAYLS